MAPATAASKYRSRSAFSAASYRVAPSSASSALLAVTTEAPCSSAERISSRAGSMPPMTSITTSMSPRATRPAASVVNSSAGTSRSRSRPSRRTAMPASSIGAPTRLLSSSASRVSSRATCVPTTPQPSRAMRRGRPDSHDETDTWQGYRPRAPGRRPSAILRRARPRLPRSAGVVPRRVADRPAVRGGWRTALPVLRRDRPRHRIQRPGRHHDVADRVRRVGAVRLRRDPRGWRKSGRGGRRRLADELALPAHGRRAGSVVARRSVEARRPGTGRRRLVVGDVGAT